jgi:hypothetical protein
MPHLQTVGAMVGYLRVHRDQRFASTTAEAPMTPIALWGRTSLFNAAREHPQAGTSNLDV